MLYLQEGQKNTFEKLIAVESEESENQDDLKESVHCSVQNSWD